VAKTLRGSWSLAKGVVFGNERLPVEAELELRLAEGLARKRREGAFALSALRDWLDTKPAEKTRNTYDAWVTKQNKHLPDGARPIPRGKALWKRWRVPWPEIVQAAEEGRVPGEQEQQDETGESVDLLVTEQEISEAISTLNFDSVLRGQQIKTAREERGWSQSGLALRVGLDPSTLGYLEKGVIRNSSFETVAKLAHTLDLSLDELAAGPPDRPADPA
jgi:ribosome-binding protein aMBF1 (putative translation factor)